MSELPWLDTWTASSIRRRLLDRDLDAVRGRMTGRVLEIGNGRAPRRGRFRPPQNGTVSWTYLDVDAGRAPHVRADIQQLPLGDGHLDTIVCLEVLEYVEQPAAAMREMHRTLRPGGTLVLSTPFLHRVDAPTDRWRFTEHGLRLLCQQAGVEFEFVACRTQGSALAVAAAAVAQALNAQPKWRRRLITALTLPMLLTMVGLDEVIVRRDPALRALTTGYLVIAQKPLNAAAQS